VRGQRVLQARRRGAEEPRAALFPHQLPGGAQRVVVQHVQRHHRPVVTNDGHQPLGAAPGLQRGHVHQRDAALRLPRQVAREVGLVHGVTGWRDIVGWRSSRWPVPPTAANRWPNSW
jgi:hypothetical protein